MLADLGNAARLDLLAQDHAEDGRFRRVFEVLLEQVGRRVLRVDGDVQQEILPGLTHGQDDGLLIGLCDLVDAAARERCVKLARQRAHRKAVKTHMDSSFLLYNSIGNIVPSAQGELKYRCTERGCKWRPKPVEYKDKVKGGIPHAFFKMAGLRQ